MELREQLPLAGISIRELLPHCQIFGADDVHIRSCCYDWNELQPGDLYVAKVGMDNDGHDHIRIAAKKGAAAILCERFVVSEVPVCLVEDTREAFGLICQRLAGNPMEKLQLVGVTGTDGKTMVSRLLHQIFDHAGIRTGVVSSLGFCDGVVSSPWPETTPKDTTPTSNTPNSTTPNARQLADNLGHLVENQCQAAILEVSSIGIAERRLSGIELDACVFTNVRKDHLDYHGNLENYRRIKTRLIDQLKPDGIAVINADDRFLNRWTNRIGCPVLTFGTKNGAEVTGEVLERTPFEQTFLLTAGNETVPVRTPIIGDFFVRHCLAAATLALTMELDLGQIVAGIEAVKVIPGRMERVQCGDGISVYVDAAQTPNQLCGMLKSLARTGMNGRIRCVFGGAERTTADQRAGLGTIAERYADQAIISGVELHNESALEVAHDILDGFDNVSQAHVIPNRAAAIRHVLDSAQPGDQILIAGLGDKPTRFGFAEEICLTDRELCQAWSERPEVLDSLCINYDETLPISYSIDNYR